MSRLVAVIAIVALLGGCAGNAMQRPIAASDEIVMQRSLNELERELDGEQLDRLRWALGVLMATRIEPPERQAFLREVIDGRTAEEIIAAADQASARYGID